MCAYVNEIVDVVTDFVRDNKMFTAWDVTIAVRKRTQDRVQHFEVKKEVHGFFGKGGMSNYSRTLANLPNVGNTQPWIYHPTNADASLYTGTPVDAGSAPATPVVLPSLPVASANDG